MAEQSVWVPLSVQIVVTHPTPDAGLDAPHLRPLDTPRPARMRPKNTL
jgi:hypothetical protein